MEVFSNIKRQLREFHTKKPQLEFFTALLTIPVLLTVIILNLNNLKADDKKEAPKSETIIITQPAFKEKEVIVTKEACKPGIGTISIEDPSENEETEDNPVLVDILYDDEEYCNVVWSYRINNGRYSDYDDRSIALYNLPNGNIKFDLRVKSVVNNDQKTLTRNFTYSGSLTPTPVPTSTPIPTPTP